LHILHCNIIEMRYSVAFSGAAGAGINTAGLILAELLLQQGLFVLGDKEYESRIKGGNNMFIVYISDESHYISRHIDVLYAFDKLAAEKPTTIYDIGEIVSIDPKSCKYPNTYALALAAVTCGIKQSAIEAFFTKKFTGEALQKNLADIQSVYTTNEIHKIHEIHWINWVHWKIMFGNEILATAAIDAWLNFYSAYPMTPASSLIDVIMEHKEVTFFQWEDEIAVSMAMLGAHYAGAKAMCGTSGGGFALMSESMSFAGQAEIGGVYILSQRAGPSTGTPTYTEQGDISYALCPTFGGIKPIVVAPSDYEDGKILIAKALERADTYQQTVIVLTDKQYAESHLSVSDDKKNVAKKQHIVAGSDNFARYTLTENGISPRTIPGVANGECIATSYEHDEHGATSEDPTMKQAMTAKREKKRKTFIQTEFTSDFVWFSVHNPDASKLFITFGANTRAIKPLLEKHPDRGMIVVTAMQPLDPRLSQFLLDRKKSITKLMFVEMNHDGQFQHHLISECNLHDRTDKIDFFRKTALYPIFEEEIEKIM
jgi:2-oxoglutarate/2-oxoacid ferredoxin oxidoreductase subunit alpha